MTLAGLRYGTGYVLLNLGDSRPFPLESSAGAGRPASYRYKQPRGGERVTGNWNPQQRPFQHAGSVTLETRGGKLTTPQQTLLSGPGPRLQVALALDAGRGDKRQNGSNITLEQCDTSAGDHTK